MDSLKILLVEDDPADIGLVRKALSDAEREGVFSAELSCAGTVVAALDRLRSDVVEAIILDLGLPDASGLDGLKKLITSAPEVPILVLTGNGNIDLALKALQQGAMDFLPKEELRAPSFPRAIRFGLERKSAEASLTALARTDTLTGLMSRAAFFERFEDVIEQARRSGRPCAVIYFDLDQFKDVNDSFGHSVGDRLLQLVARRLQELTRTTDFCARLGGDEFVVVATNIEGVASATTVAGKIIDAVETIRIDEHPSLRPRASLGIALSSAKTKTTSELLGEADTALYEAKRQSRGGFRFYDARMNEAVQRRRALAEAMRQSLAGGGFELCYQPIVDVEINAVCALEGLARWYDHPHGIVDPEEFIPLAEESGSIGMLWDQLLDALGKDGRSWLLQRPRPVPVTLNVSQLQFHHQHFAESFLRRIRDLGLPPDALELELRESLVMRDFDATYAQLRMLSDAGVRIAVDDFGTGYSRLAILRKLPLHSVKISRDLIRSLPDDADSRSVVSGLTAMAASIGLGVTAVGVETASQMAFLRHFGISRMQGNYFTLPLSAGDVPSWIDAYSSGRPPPAGPI